MKLFYRLNEWLVSHIAEDTCPEYSRLDRENGLGA